MLTAITGPGLLGLLLLLAPAQDPVGGFHEWSRVSPSGAGPFGDPSLAVDGNTVVAGAPGQGGGQDGTVYFFERQGGQLVEVASFTGSAPYADEVDLDGHRAVTSSGNDVVAFRFDGAAWVVDEVISVPGNGFVAAVAIHGDRIAVGKGGLGTVHVFERSPATAWSPITTLTPFGPGITIAVELGDDLVVVSDAGSNQVTAFRDLTGSLTEVGPIQPPAQAFAFGQELSLSGDTLLVHDVGRAAAYRLSGAQWVAEGLLNTPNTTTAVTLSIAGDFALVASGNPDTRVYPFERSGTTWSALGEFTPADVMPLSLLNSLVAATDGTTAAILLPALGANGTLVDYVLLDARTTYCTGKLNSLGCVPFITTNTGTPSVSQPFFGIQARDVLPGEMGLVLYSASKANLAFHGGRLCVKAPIRRALPELATKASGPLPCQGVGNRNFNSLIQSGIDPALTVGQTVHAQWLLRDPADPAGFGDSLTDALRFQIAP